MVDFNGFLAQTLRYDRWHFSDRRQRVNKPDGQSTFPTPVECSLALSQSEFGRVPAFSRHHFPRPAGCQEVLFFTEVHCPELAGYSDPTSAWIVHILDSDCRVEVDEGLNEVLPVAAE